MAVRVAAAAELGRLPPPCLPPLPREARLAALREARLALRLTTLGGGGGMSSRHTPAKDARNVGAPLYRDISSGVGSVCH